MKVILLCNRCHLVLVVFALGGLWLLTVPSRLRNFQAAWEQKGWISQSPRQWLHDSQAQWLQTPSGRKTPGEEPLRPSERDTHSQSNVWDSEQNLLSDRLIIDYLCQKSKSWRTKHLWTECCDQLCVTVCGVKWWEYQGLDPVAKG